MVHAALRTIGPIVGGPDALIAALCDVVGPEGTILGYADWQGQDEVDAGIDRADIAPFDPLTSRANRDNGWFPEALRTTPGALRSGNPGASVVALGGKAAWLTADRPLDYGYGPGSPLAKLVEANGKVLMLGAPLDTITLLHHAEHLARIPGKRVKRYEAPILIGGKAAWFTADHPLDYGYGPGSPLARLVEANGMVLMLGAPLDTITLLHHAEHLARIPGKHIKHYDAPILVSGKTVWRTFEEFDTSHPVVDGLDEDYFAAIVEEFLASGRGRRGTIGSAPSVHVPAHEIVTSAVTWLERRISSQR